MTVIVPVLVSLLAFSAHPTPESLVGTGFARRSPGRFFPVSPIRFAIPRLTSSRISGVVGAGSVQVYRRTCSRWTIATRAACYFLLCCTTVTHMFFGC